jgi:hypothetical protein
LLGGDQTFVTGEPGDLFGLQSTSTGQRVNVGIGSLYPYYNASFSMVGPPGSLFDPFLPQTLRVDANTFLTNLSFFGGRDFGLGGLNNLRVRFDGVGTVAVPELGVLGIVGVGLAGLAGLAARPRRVNCFWPCRALQETIRS